MRSFWAPGSVLASRGRPPGGGIESIAGAAQPHLGIQMPRTQLPDMQLLPQVPQFCLSASRFTHLFLQRA